MVRMLSVFALVGVLAAAATAQASETYDIVVYGGTAGGVMAAVQAARMGKSVALIEPTQHLGGMTTGGLSYTDTGSTDAIQGIAREFYLRCGQAYGSSSPEWRFEPYVAENVLDTMISQAGVTVYRSERLDLAAGVTKAGNIIQSIRMESGLQFNASMFIDAGYEGDLMAKAGVSYTTGREANATYGESYNGVQKARSTNHQFSANVDPYVIPGNPSSGLLPYVSGDPPGTDGTADSRIQAYNYRLIVTQNVANKRAWTAPANYAAANYELLRRYIQAQGITTVKGTLLKIDSIKGGKFDVNNQGAISTDFIGQNYAFPSANYATRDQIAQAHREWQQGLIYFVATDPALPASIRNEMNSYGLTLDEFTDNDGWSNQLYIREARRMLGTFVMTDREVVGGQTVPQPVCLGSYTMDSHNAQRYVTDAGYVRNEGNVQVGVPEPYGIAYGALLPVEAEAANLLVSSALSASHIAFGSIRMEPVFMETGQAAGTAAVLALNTGTSVQGLDYLLLQQRLIADGALIGWPNNPGPPFTGTVYENFNHLTSLPQGLRYTGGGEGWSGNWDETGTENVVAGDLLTAQGGYSAPQTGPGDAGKVQGVYDSRRQNMRDLVGDLAGEIWFSLLLLNPDATACAGISFNPENNGDPAKPPLKNLIELDGANLEVTLDGILTGSGIATLTVGQTHLILGRMVVGAGADSFELWADPDDLAHLGDADFAVVTLDFFDAVSGLGVLSYNPAGPAWTANGGYIDAIRLSNTADAFFQVTGVPEPATLALLAMGAAAVAGWRRRRG